MKISVNYLIILGIIFNLSNNKNQIESNRFKASTTASSTFKAVNDLDSINIGELSCRARTPTNVGIDAIIEKDFRKGKASFMRYEMFKPEALWGDKDLDFYEEECPLCPPKNGPEDKRTKCIKAAPVVTKGLARNFFTVLYPLVGEAYYTEFKAAVDKLKPKGNTYDEVAGLFDNVPFDKLYFTAYSRNAQGTLPSRVVLYLLIRNSWAGFTAIHDKVNKLFKVLKCAGYRKFAAAEDIYTALLNNDIVELKPPPVWVNAFVLNTANTANKGFDLPKLFVALGLGYQEYFTNSDDKMVEQAQVTEEWNEQCKIVREYMVSMWAYARDIKCGDAGWTPPPADPAAPADPTTPAPAAAGTY